MPQAYALRLRSVDTQTRLADYYQIILLPEVEGSGAFNCVTERIRTGRNVAIKNVDRKTRLFLLVERTELRRPSAAGQGEVAPRGTLMRKTGSRQSRRWIRTRRARDHMQARAKLIQRAPRGSPQHLTLTRWPGGLLFHDLGSPSASEPTATAPSRDSRPKGPRAAPVLRFLLTQSEYSGVFRERQRRRS